MAGARLTITLDAAQVQAALQRLATADTAELMPRLGEYLQRTTQDRFKTQTAPDGTPWTPLQPRYARRKKYNQDKVLTLRGYLRSGIHYQVTAPDTVEVGTNTKYGAIHQLGGTIDMPARQAKVRYRSVAGHVLFAKKTQRRGVTEQAVTIDAHQVKMPPRPFLGISADDHREVLDIFKDWLLGSDGK